VMDGPQAAHMPAMVNLRQEPSGRANWLILLHQRPPVFVGLGRLEPGLYTLLVPDTPSLTLFLEIVGDEQTPEVPAARIITRAEGPTATEGQVQVTHIFESHAAELLADVRLGRAQLDAVELPPRAAITLCWREGSAAYQERKLVPDREEKRKVLKGEDSFS